MLREACGRLGGLDVLTPRKRSMAWACYCSNSKRGGGGQNVDQVLQGGWMADYFIVDSGDFHCREQMPDSNWYKHESRKVAREPLECSCRSK